MVHHGAIIYPNQKKPVLLPWVSVSNRSELQALSALPGHRISRKLNEPGHGEIVRLTDPGGLRVDIVHGRGAFIQNDTSHRCP